MSDRLSTWPLDWREDTIHYSAGCHICGSCSEPGWVRAEAISSGFCKCCISALVKAAPHIARSVLAETTPNDQGGQT